MNVPMPWGALFLILLGAGLLAVAWMGWRSGELPAGSQGWKAWRPNRDDNPLAFHFFLLVYLCGGLALLVWGMMQLLGRAPPLPLR